MRNLSVGRETASGPATSAEDRAMLRAMQAWRFALRRRDGALDGDDADVVRLVPRELRRAA
jgi:hypothetical protein